MDISIIICTKDRADDLRRLLDSLCHQNRMPNEAIIIDASQNEKTKDMVEHERAQIPFPVIYKTTDPGLTRQRNIGVDLSQGEYICFFDDDVILDPDYISIIEATFKQPVMDQLGGVTGRITNIKENASAWEKFFRKIFFLNDFGQGKIKFSGFPSHKIDKKPAFVKILSGCNMVYRRDVFSEFHFDECFSGYSYLEDVDFSFRVGKKFLLYYQPKAKIEHYPTAYKTYDSRALRKMMIQNHRYLFKKNHDQKFINIMCHLISIMGVFLYNGFIQRDLSACRGIVEGLLEPLEC